MTCFATDMYSARSLRLRQVLGLGLALGLIPAPSNEDEVRSVLDSVLTPTPLGQWARGDGKAKVVIAPCGADICAINTWIRSDDHEEKVGERLVMSVKAKSRTQWQGKAYDPQRNLRYRLDMTVAEATMTTTGCVFGGLICKSVTWTRISL